MRVKNWKRHQHFKDRNPPWIKLHRSLLDQRDINLISDRCFRVLIGLWLLASEDEEKNGNLPDVSDIAFRLRMDEIEIIKSIQGLGDFVEHDDIDLISRRYQLDDPETETETETETDIRSNPHQNEIDFEVFWDRYPRKVGKKKAAVAWGRLSKTKQQSALDDLQSRYEGADTQFIPHPTTYLHGERWNDQEPSSIDQSSSIPKGAEGAI